MKIGLNWFIPAFANSREGSLTGTTDAKGEEEQEEEEEEEAVSWVVLREVRRDGGRLATTSTGTRGHTWRAFDMRVSLCLEVVHELAPHPTHRPPRMALG